MAIDYSVRANVVDINRDIPVAEDVFLVDTNIWYWMTYPKATSHLPSQLSEYPDYLNKALGASAAIHHTGLSLAELAHLIEKTEREIYKKARGPVLTKEYRHNIAVERTRVVSEIEAVWAQITSLSDLLAVTIDGSITEAALARINTEKVDGYDLFILESMKNHAVVKVITDDGDFSTVPDLYVFTANRTVINAARSQGKLVKR